jgi:rare lipoprotein A
MGREDSTVGTIKCRKFTGLVDFHKTMSVITTTLWGRYCAWNPRPNRGSRYISENQIVCRIMSRQFLAMAGIAAGILLALHPGRAHAEDNAPSNTRNSSNWSGETGYASYYGRAHHGKRTASGARFDQKALTAAHPWLPFGTKVRVTVTGTSRSVIVVITDRLYSHRRVVDLSVGAAERLGIIRQGVANVSLTPA